MNSLVAEHDYEQPGELYSLLEAGTKRELLEVFAIPTNVIEIALCPQAEKRHFMAKRLNELISGIRMSPSFEYATTWRFCQIVSKQFEGALNSREPLELLSRNNVVPFIGLLGQMAALREYPLGNFEPIVRTKFATTLAQLRIMSEPDIYIHELAKQAIGESPDPAAIEALRSIDQLSLDDLKNEIVRVQESIVRVKNVTRLQKSRDALTRQYTAHALFETIMNCFHYYEDILRVFNFSAIIVQWDNRVPGAEKCDNFMPLPEDITVEGLEPRLDEPLMGKYFQIIQLLCHRYSSGLLPTMFFGIRRFLLELERNLRDPRKLSEGLNLDLNYLSQLDQANCFISFDSFQANGANEYVKNLLSADGGNGPRIRIFRSVGDLRELLNQR